MFPQLSCRQIFGVVRKKNTFFHSLHTLWEADDDDDNSDDDDDNDTLLDHLNEPIKCPNIFHFSPVAGGSIFLRLDLLECIPVTEKCGRCIKYTFINKNNNNKNLKAVIEPSLNCHN